MEKYYRIQFTSTLQKMALAFKMQCDIQIFWKRGQKIAETGKVPFRNCTAYFNKQLTISCNMIFDTQQKVFKEKETKFAFVIYTEKGNKQAGQILFDVAPFLNERCKSKSYQLNLSKCPDKNAKLFFSLKANIMQEKSYDTISESSLVSVDIQNLTGEKRGQLQSLKLMTQSTLSHSISLPQMGNKSSTSIMHKNKQKIGDMVPTTDKAVQRDKKEKESNWNMQRSNSNNQRGDYNNERIPQNVGELIKGLQTENRKIKEQLKRKEELKKENEELKKKLKEDDYQSCKEYKKKIQQGKKEIDNLVQQSKGAKKVNEDIKRLQRDILKSKQLIMRIFNQAEKFGPQVFDRIQQQCGIKQY